MSVLETCHKKVDLDQFKKEGWLLIRGLIPAHILEDVKEVYASAADQIIAQAYTEGLISTRFEDTPFEKRLAQLPQDFLKRYGRSWRNSVAKAPVFNLQTCPELVDIMTTLMGSELAGSELFNARPKMPNQELTVVPWHQDAGYYGPLSVKNEAFTTWIPLVPVSADNGCMQVVPKSDINGFRHHADQVGEGSFKEIDDDSINEVDAITCPMEPGDILIFNQLTYHRSLPNTTDAIRWSIDLRFYRLGEPPVESKEGEENPWVINSRQKSTTTLKEWEEMVKDFGW